MIMAGPAAFTGSERAKCEVARSKGSRLPRCAECRAHDRELGLRSPTWQGQVIARALPVGAANAPFQVIAGAGGRCIVDANALANEFFIADRLIKDLPGQRSQTNTAGNSDEEEKF